MEMTDIQQKSIMYSLARRDLLGAAKTGSGKTLAFLIPVLEILFREQWSGMDGLGALIVSPTRELAVQIFTVLKRIGKEHSFSAGLIIGGKDVNIEQERISRMNIIVCTPGRLLQHMDQTPDFNYDNLKVLVLDEADRILDMGFSVTVNAILDNLPKERQTLLFSATQTKSVKDLARLSLSDPEYIAVHEKAETSTPAQLHQHYIEVELPDKLDLLFSFYKSLPQGENYCICLDVQAGPLHVRIFLQDAARCSTHAAVWPTKAAETYRNFQQIFSDEERCSLCH